MQINLDALLSLQILLDERHASTYSDVTKEGSPFLVILKHLDLTACCHVTRDTKSYAYPPRSRAHANANGWTRPTLMCDVLDISQGHYMGSTEVSCASHNRTIGTLSKSWSTIDSSRMTLALLGAVVLAFSRKLLPAQIQIRTKLRKSRTY
jgi:hypothetical protein